MKDVYDVVVIGAGLYGIQAARTYLEIHPLAKLIIIESDDVVGGVWSRKRVYSSFISQTPTSMSQFSDTPLILSSAEAKKHSPFCHANHIADYLERYVHSHSYNNTSLHERISFNTRVHKVTSLSNSSANGKWALECSKATVIGDTNPSKLILRTNILFDCTGLASQPLIPNIPGQQTFAGLQIHQKEFSKYEKEICSSQMERNVTVIGGAKSAADVVYALAKHHNLRVSWIIRRDGNGPAALLPSKGAESFYTRLVAGFLPCIFGKESWWEGLVHRTKIGRGVVAKMWERADSKYRSEARFGRKEGREMGFAELESKTP